MTHDCNRKMIHFNVKYPTQFKGRFKKEMIKVDKIAEVRRLRKVEELSIREVAEKVELAPNTVQKILNSNMTKFDYHRNVAVQPVTGGYFELIEGWLKEDEKKRKKQRRTACRIYKILKKEHGYTGSYESIARSVRILKEKLDLEKKEGYIPLEFEPGEAFQFDWGEVSAIINGEEIKLYLGIITLCYSRVYYARVYLSQKQEFMLDIHVRAFKFFGGVSKRGIYDNLKAAVTSLLKGRHRNVNERFKLFCSHYLYEPDFCSPCKGNEKGRVENKIGYVRRNYFIPIINIENVDKLNDGLLEFCIKSSKENQHPDYEGKKCYELLEEECASFIELPKFSFECCRLNHNIVSSLSVIMFENNYYSVPAKHIGKNVMIRGYTDTVVISYEGNEAARHTRLFGWHEKSLNPYHYLSILEHKPGAIRNGKPFKNWELPEIFVTYRVLLKKKYEDGEIYFAKTLILLKDWSLEEVTEALEKCVTAGLLSDAYVLNVLNKKKENIIEEQEELLLREDLMKYQAGNCSSAEYNVLLNSANIEAMQNE